MKKALIFGVTGQDGSYLAEVLLEKGYEVHGTKRRSSSLNTQRIDHLYNDPLQRETHFYLHYCDVTDSLNISELISKVKPDEIYNLAAQSHVGVSFSTPEYTANVDGLGCLRILESIRLLGLGSKTKFYQASTSELYGLVQEVPQRESTPFYPRSPYAVAKLYAYWITKNYREAYNMFACNGILFNHESPRRGETFVTRKITRGLARLAYGLDSILLLGNLDAKRDWGHAKDYVEMQWLMLQQKDPQDFVIASGEQYSIREFIKMCCDYLDLNIKFVGKGINEKAIVLKSNTSITPNIQKEDIIIKVDKSYFRPTEVDTLLGDSSVAFKKLKWKPKILINDLCKEMLDYDLFLARNEFKINQSNT